MVLMMKHKLTVLLCAVGLLALLAACGPAAEGEPTPAAEANATAALESAAEVATSTVPAIVPAEGYPAPAPTEVVAYPAPGEATALPEGYPAPTQEVFKEPRFRFDVPLTPGATTVTGQAPPDVALAVLDVTYNGALLGTGRSDADGRFSIPVSPLSPGNRIGITVGELAEGQTLNQMAEMYYPYRGDGFMNLPNIGILFETAQVDQQ